MSTLQYHSAIASPFQTEKLLLQQAENTYMSSNALGNLLMLLGVLGRKMEGNTKLVPHLFFTSVESRGWERENPSFSITLNVSLLCSYSHARHMPLTANHLLVHYQQAISSPQHNFLFPHEGFFLGSPWKQPGFTSLFLIFGSSSPTEKTLWRMGVGDASCLNFFIGFQGKPYTVTLLTQFTLVDLCSLHCLQYEKNPTHTHTLVFSVAT